MKSLREEMIERFERIDGRFEQIDGRFEQIDGRFEQIDERFERIDERFDQIDGRFEQVEGGFAAVTKQLVEQRAYTEFGYDRLDKTLHALGGGLARLERKLDRILALGVESRGRNR
jgi:predicted nuclease with TOPRIM domain